MLLLYGFFDDIHSHVLELLLIFVEHHVTNVAVVPVSSATFSMSLVCLHETFRVCGQVDADASLLVLH